MNIRHEINMSPRKYFTKIVFPSLILSTLVAVVIYFLLDRNSSSFKFVAFFIPIIGIIYSVAYPTLKTDRRKNEIDSKAHFFITAFGVLSKSDVNRKSILKMISEKKELGYLATEIYKLYVLVDRWNQSISKSARFLSKRTSSRTFSDFLDRFAHSQDSGEDMDKFLYKEQETVMNGYSTYYKGALYEIDLFKEIYSAILLSLVFLMAFVIIIPMLMGGNLVRMIIYISIFFMVVEIALIYFVKSVTPYDPIWHSRDIVTRTDRKLLFSFIISIAGCVFVALIIHITQNTEFTRKIPFQFLISFAISPLLYSGFISRREENVVKRKDDNFSSFLRTLGSSASARGGLILEPLYYLTTHDFGPLTGDIKNLYRRLSLRINGVKSWNFFSAETGSYLIDIFSKLFVESISLGGEAGDVSDIISSNFNRILTLRKQKFQVTSSFIGIVYGITAGVVFSMAISFTIAQVINSLYLGLNVNAGALSGILYTTSPSNLQIVSFIIFLIFIIHSLLSAVLIRVIDGGHYLNTLIHFVFLVWTSAIVMFISEKVVTSLISTKI
ncbi:MAG TPA: archaellar assembly protein FlaJ [Euryarchaeota archaeon]|nr:flagellar assembly protein J [archaeon BMS3Bbin15]HDL15466.1 archaellar assembly protein FlaJ [Euryarchaeota archaeon]